jgi:nicotinate-nucleotide adenylyltransferase
MRIGFFGGTFDPPHRAHLRAAQAAADRFALDRVLLAPTGFQPLKAEPPQVSFEDRLTMTRLLCAHDGQEPEAQLFALAGADSFLTLRHWRQPQRLLQLAEWIVVSRPDFSLDEISSMNLTAEERSRVHLLPELDEDVSATGIRERLRVGVSCGTMLTPSVALYIARMHLYHA